MIFRNIQDIKYPFLKEAATKLSKNYSLKDIYMDKQGELCLTFKETLSVDDIQFIMNIITPKEHGFDNYTVSSSDYCYNKENYCYNMGKQETHVYSVDGIDYRKIA